MLFVKVQTRAGRTAHWVEVLRHGLDNLNTVSPSAGGGGVLANIVEGRETNLEERRMKTRLA